MTHDRPHRRRAGAGGTRAPSSASWSRAGALDKRAVDAVLEAAGAAPLRRPAGPPGRAQRPRGRGPAPARAGPHEQGDRRARWRSREKTAGHHVEHIYAKTGVTTRVGAALFAMRHDLAELEDGEFSRCGAPACGGRIGRAPCPSTSPSTASASHYEEHGSGAPILCIHGTGSSALVLERRDRALARLGRVIAYDRRGCRRSERPEPYERTSVAEHADDAAALLDALDAAPAVVIGRSYGGTVAHGPRAPPPRPGARAGRARGRRAARARAGGDRLDRRAGRPPARGRRA